MFTCEPKKFMLMSVKNMGQWWRWALVVRMEWRPARWSVCLPLLISPCTIKSRSSLLAPAYPGGPEEKGHKTVVWLWWSVKLRLIIWNSFSCFPLLLVNAGILYWKIDISVYCILLLIQQQQPFYDPLSVTSWVSRYQKKHSPTHHPDQPVFISFFHLPRSIASSLFKLRAWQSFCTTSVHVLFGLPLGLEPSTSYSIHFFPPNHCLLFATHAHTIETCFAVVSILYHLFLVFLSTPYLELYLLP